MIIFNTNFIYSIILFIVYTLIGTLLPLIISYNDPTSAMAVYLIILPLAYIIIGILSGLVNIKWPFATITAALATSPILITYEFIDDFSGVGISFLVYLIIFIISYFILLSLITKKLDKKYDNKRILNLLLITSIVVTSIFIIHTIISTVILMLCIGCSAAYYTPLVINFFIYIIPIVITWSLYIYNFFQYKKLN